MFLAYPLQHPVIISSFFYVMQINPCLSYQELGIMSWSFAGRREWAGKRRIDEIRETAAA